MQPKNFQQQQLELQGWPVTLSSFELQDVFVAQVESTASLTVLVSRISKTREEAQKDALEAAAMRLLCTSCIDAELTVGG